MARVSMLAIFVLAASVPAATAQDKPPLSQEELEKAYAELATPGPEHERFKEMVGEWKAVCKSYENPDQPTVTEASATFRVILGGRYLQQRFTGTFEGMDFTGIGTTGYDKAQKKYVGVWIDNMGTGIMHTEGQFDEATGTMSETGQVHGPQGPMKLKMISKEKSDDAFTFTMYMVLPDGTERKQMEIDYTRVAKQE